MAPNLITKTLLASIILGVAALISSCGTVTPPATATVSPPTTTVDWGGTKVPAVVATRDIAVGTRLTADMVTVREFDQDQVPPFSFRSPQLVVGKYAYIPIHVGMAIADVFLVSESRTNCPPSV